MSAIQYKNFHDWVTDLVKANKNKWGYQSQLAQAAGCQRSYFSQVLKGKAVFMPDHILGMAHFLDLSDEETQYLLDLNSLERAASLRLKKFYENKTQKARQDAENLSKRFKVDTISISEHQSVYYSTWLLPALHILSGIQEFQSVDSMAKRLQIPSSVALSSLKQLSTLGLCEDLGKGKWQNTKGLLHISKDSSVGLMNHSNWRARALLDAQTKSPEAIHYTAVMSMLEKDYLKIKKCILEAIDKSREIVRASDKQEVYAMTCDLFKI